MPEADLGSLDRWKQSFSNKSLDSDKFGMWSEENAAQFQLDVHYVMLPINDQKRISEKSAKTVIGLSYGLDWLPISLELSQFW